MKPKNTREGLYKQLADLLLEHNPGRIPLIQYGPRDEYEPEVELILPELENCKSEEDVLELVHGVFVRMFDESWVGPKSGFEPVARDIWKAWQKRSAE